MAFVVSREKERESRTPEHTREMAIVNLSSFTTNWPADELINYRPHRCLTFTATAGGTDVKCSPFFSLLHLRLISLLDVSAVLNFPLHKLPHLLAITSLCPLCNTYKQAIRLMLIALAAAFLMLSPLLHCAQHLKKRTLKWTFFLSIDFILRWCCFLLLFILLANERVRRRFVCSDDLICRTTNANDNRQRAHAAG